MATATLPATLQQSALPALVTCSICERLVLFAETVTYEIIEAIDGNQQNLSRENIRLTGERGYECETCFVEELQTVTTYH